MCLVLGLNHLANLRSFWAIIYLLFLCTHQINLKNLIIIPTCRKLLNSSSILDLIHSFKLTTTIFPLTFKTNGVLKIDIPILNRSICKRIIWLIFFLFWVHELWLYTRFWFTDGTSSQYWRLYLVLEFLLGSKQVDKLFAVTVNLC